MTEFVIIMTIITLASVMSFFVGKIWDDRYSRDELLKRDIVEYDKSGKVVWVQDVNLKKEEK